MSLQEKLLSQVSSLADPEVIDITPESNVVSIRNAAPLDVVPAFAITLAEAKDRISMLQEFVKDMMIPGQDSE